MGVTPMGGGRNTREVGEIRHDSTNNSLYLGSGTRQTESFYEELIESHTRTVDW